MNRTSTSSLVLFDVDGTLLITKGATSRCILRACQELFGGWFEWRDVTVGTLDQQIFADLCTANGVSDAVARLEEYKRTYLPILSAELDRVRDDIVVLPGVRETLTRLHEVSDVTIGIVSGNFRQAVELKLDAAGLERSLFTVMACAEDGDSRLDLPRVAMQQYASQTGDTIDPAQVFVIGDTTRDIECAHACGARAIAVATGRYGLDELDSADLCLTDLSTTDRLMEFIANR